jgi:3-deoxy-D-arabino-heptulosonate 7-phosphate (DAHP) synthase
MAEAEAMSTLYLAAHAATSIGALWAVWNVLHPKNRQPFTDAAQELHLDTLATELGAQGVQTFVVWQDGSITTHSRN